MAEQLITGLSQSPDIYVTARTSSFAFKDKSITAQQIADQLGVRYLLEGSVQRDAELVSINVQLIDGRNENHIWEQHYDSKFEDLSIYPPKYYLRFIFLVIYLIHIQEQQIRH